MTASTPIDNAPKPTKMVRAKIWDPEVEDAYRFQIAGWRDAYEYEATHGEYDRWPESNWPKKLEVKGAKTMTLYYYSKARECKDKHLNQIKLYSY